MTAYNVTDAGTGETFDYHANSGAVTLIKDGDYLYFKTWNSVSLWAAENADTTSQE